MEESLAVIAEEIVPRVPTDGVVAPENIDGAVNTSKAFSRTDILRLISQNSARISYTKITSKRSLSNVWKMFEVINVDEKPVNFVRCSCCHTIYAWNSKTGTTTLSRHICSDVTVGSKIKKHQGISSNTTQPPITAFVARNVPKSDLEHLNENIVTGLAKDLRPLRSVEGIGFLSIAQSLIDFGAKHGRQNAKDVISHRTHLKTRYLPSIATRLEKKISEILLTTSSYPRFSFTTDMWSDQYQQRNYLSLHVHFVNNHWELCSFMLGVEEFTETVKSTGNIRDLIILILKKYIKEDDKLEEVFESSLSITDGGTNMVNIFPIRYPCMCHRMNLLVHWTLNRKDILSDAKIQKLRDKGKEPNPKKLFNIQTSCPTINSVLIDLKRLVEYFKRSGLNKNLSYSLKQDVETRWNSLVTMLESYQRSADEVKAILLEKRKIDKVIHISDDVVSELIKFLKPFQECTEVFSGDRYPTIYFVALWYHKIQAHLEDAENDSEEIKKLKTQARICFDEYFEVEEIHYAACLLHPKYRKLKFATEATRNDAVALLKELADEFSAEIQLTSTAPNDETPPSKKTKYSEFEDSDDDNENELHEVDRYLGMSLHPGDYDGIDILSFWKNATMWPKLQKVSSWLLAIPASQTSDERVFSTTGQTLLSRRTNLKGSTLSMLTFINKNA